MIRILLNCGFLLASLFSFTIVSAFPVIDTNKVLLAEAKMTEPLTITREANIVFPDILKGNEENSLDYIENFSSKKRNYLIHTYKKSTKLFPKAAAILKKYNLPSEMRVLLAIESGFNPNAVSKAGAVGYWQIMDAVAKEYKLNYVLSSTLGS